MAIPSLSWAQTDSLDIKIGQMIIIGLDDFNKLDKKEPIFHSIRTGTVGNIIIFEKHINPKKPAKSLKEITDYINLIAPIKPLIGIDEEGGKVNRLKPKYGFPKTVSAQYLGDLHNEDSTRYYASSSAIIMKSLGINMNFAPTVDVKLNPKNPVIAKPERSYSADPDTVSFQAGIMIDEQSKYGIINVLKHFPGHGSSNSDSHYGMADVTDTWKIDELFPYNTLIREGKVKAIMTAHIVNGQLDEERNPATLSEKIVTGLLRDFLRFEGVIFSDAMEMQAISKHYGTEEAVVKAINAGVDIVMFGNNGNLADEIRPFEIHDMIKRNVIQGNIPLSRIDESFRRIMKLKNSIK